MSARDIFHEPFTHALLKDGWTITHDRLTIPFDGTELFVDIGAERLIGAERDGERIAVELRSKSRAFSSLRLFRTIKKPWGSIFCTQYILYSDIMADSPENTGRTLYLAIREETYRIVFSREQTQRLLQNRNIRLIVFNPEEEVITQWKS